MVYFLDMMWIAFKDIAASPFQAEYLSVWWFLGPIILFWIILEVYFGKHKAEELGWNTALGNGMSLVWVNIESMRFLWHNHPTPFWLRFVIILTILSYGSFIIYISFSHRLSPKTTYALASPTPIYYFAFISVLWGHGALTLTWWVLLDLIIIYPLVMSGILLLKKLLPGATEESGFEGSKDDDLGDLKI